MIDKNVDEKIIKTIYKQLLKTDLGKGKEFTSCVVSIAVEYNDPEKDRKGWTLLKLIVKDFPYKRLRWAKDELFLQLVSYIKNNKKTKE